MSSKQPAPAYLLLGPEVGQKQEFIDKIRKALETSLGEPPEFFRYYPYETDLSEILSHIRNGSLFSPHKLVLLNNVEAVTKKKDLDLLKDYCRQPSQEATLLLISDEFKVQKSLMEVFPGQRKKVFWELFENQKQSWITRFFRRRGHPIPGETVDLLLELVENNTEQLQLACSNLLHFLKEGQPVTEDIVETYVFHSREENVFTLFDSFCRRDLPGSLEILKKILLSPGQEPVGILGGLIWQLRRLHAARKLTDQGKPLQQVFSTLFIRSKKNQSILARGLKNYTAAELENLLSETADLDADLRGGHKTMQETRLQLFLFRAYRPEPRMSWASAR